MQTALSVAIASAGNELSIELARHPRQIIEAKRIRYRVYCEERGFEPGVDGLEQDEFDSHACHILIRGKKNRRIYGTVRLVLDDGPLAPGFPMERVCESSVVASLPRSTTAEISRFALTRDREGLSPHASALLRLYLIQGVIAFSGELGLTHWCAIMERTLLRLLRSTSIYFLPVGPTIEYHGVRQPAMFILADGLGRLQRESPGIWSFLTQSGTLWPNVNARTLANQQIACAIRHSSRKVDLESFGAADPGQRHLEHLNAEHHVHSGAPQVD